MAVFFLSGGGAFAQAAGTTVTGTILDQKSAISVAGATITLTQGDRTVAKTQSDSAGHFAFSSVAPGIYDLTIRADGYAPNGTIGLVVSAGGTVHTDAALVRVTTSGLRVIGRTSSATNPLAAATTISQTINIQNAENTGAFRFSDLLGTLPALNFGTSSSVGDDASINIRGFGSTETQALLDGHPVGPYGVGGGGSYNWALAPNFGINKVEVVYGSGAQGLYGSDTIGGSVNLDTINPTLKPQATYQQQFGGFGALSSSFTSTGTLGRLG